MPIYYLMKKKEKQLLETNKELKSYTINEVMTLLKLSRRTIYQYLETGQLKGYKVTSGWRIRETELMKFITLHEARALKRVK